MPKKINDFLELNNENRAILLHSYSMIRNGTESVVKFSFVNLNKFSGSHIKTRPSKTAT
jgi:hypothetical protein